MPRINKDLVVVFRAWSSCSRGRWKTCSGRSSRPCSPAAPTRCPHDVGRGCLPAPADVGQHHPAGRAAGARRDGGSVLRALEAWSTSRLEGKMLGAAFAAAAVAQITGSAWLGVLAGMAFGVALALVHGFASITHRGDQVVSGMALNVIAAGPWARARRRLVSPGGSRPGHGCRCAASSPSTCRSPMRSDRCRSWAQSTQT